MTGLRTSSYVHVFCVIVTSIGHRQWTGSSRGIPTATRGPVGSMDNFNETFERLCDRDCHHHRYSVISVIIALARGVRLRRFNARWLSSRRYAMVIRSLTLYSSIWQRWNLDGASRELAELAMRNLAHVRDRTIITARFGMPTLYIFPLYNRVIISG